MLKIVGVGEMVISNDADDTIKTFALASCVGVVAYSPEKKVGGILHIALPDSKNEEEKRSRRCYYASTGVPFFISELCKECGCHREDLTIRIYGGANSIRKNDVFDVGRKNIEIVYHILNEMNLKIVDAHTGKHVSRTITLNLCSGEISISYQKIII